MSKFSEDYTSYLKQQNEQIKHCYKFWHERSKKVLKKSEQFNVIHVTMGLLKILENLNDDILKTEENDND
ncbi:MAG: hypothetical protein K5752_04430 [Succinivibrionaceae bacterium]|nr:hypothetical protein [Succinivibrionaceae bacterium]